MTEPPTPAQTHAVKGHLWESCICCMLQDALDLCKEKYKLAQTERLRRPTPLNLPELLHLTPKTSVTQRHQMNNTPFQAGSPTTEARECRLASCSKMQPATNGCRSPENGKKSFGNIKAKALRPRSPRAASTWGKGAAALLSGGGRGGGAFELAIDSSSSAAAEHH